MIKQTSLSVVLGTLLFIAPALAAQDQLGDWDYAPIYKDWRLSTIVGGTAYNDDGVYIGTVEDAVIDEDGFIESVIIRSGGGLKDGKFFEIPWTDVDYDPTYFSVNVDKSMSDLRDIDREKYSFEFLDDGAWVASSLMSLTVNLDGVAPYGKVKDALVSASGLISSYIVEPDGVYELYALPFNSEWIDDSAEYLNLPYTDNVIVDLDEFDYPRVL